MPARPSNARLWGALALSALVVLGCGAISVTQPPPEAPDPPRPDRLEGEVAPALEETAYGDLLKAVVPDATVYHSPKAERWYRWAFNHWYVAFSWDGNWFPLPDEEVPDALIQARPPPTEEEVVDQLERLEHDLEKIERVEDLPALPGDYEEEKSLEERLRALEEEMRRIEEGEEPDTAPER